MKLDANHFFLSTANVIQQICQPLLRLCIDHFSFTRTYLSGKRVYLSTHPELLNSYFTNEFYLIGSCESKPTFYTPQMHLWSTLPQKKMYADAGERGIPEGVFIVKPHAHYTDFFNLATTDFTKNIANIYLSNFEVLNNFLENFKHQADALIRRAEKLEFYLPHQENILTFIENVPAIDITTDIIPKKLPLSKQQYECAVRLISGASFKEIAKDLDLSPRTIETYVDNLKSKFHVRNKVELIIKLNSLLNS